MQIVINHLNQCLLGDRDSYSSESHTHLCLLDSRAIKSIL